MAYDGRVRAAWLLMGFGISIAGPLYAQITGRVVVNGGAPPDHVYVTVHCEGSARWDWAGYTDKRGEFVAMPAESRPRFDAESDNGECQIVATARGFRRGVAETAHTYESNVVLKLTPLAEGGERRLHYVDVAVPAAARNLFDQASQHARAGRWKAAEGKLRKALAVYPSYALAWNELGLVMQNSGKQDDAEDAYATALALNPLLFSAAARLSVLQAERQRWDHVAATTDAAIVQNPVEWPSLFFYN